jgi:hypothetical protein
VKPLGHDGARTEREDTVIRYTDRLRDAFQEYWDVYGRYCLAPSIVEAKCILEHIKPPREELDHFLASQTRHDAHLGAFLTAGYQFLKEREIVYDFDTPEIHYLGYMLKDKHLIINGTAGHAVGQSMHGELTINGAVGEFAGYQMIGTCTIRGVATDRLGINMRGEAFDLRTHSGDADWRGMVGVRNGRWRIREPLWETLWYGARRLSPRRKRFLEELHAPGMRHEQQQRMWKYRVSA